MKKHFLLKLFAVIMLICLSMAMLTACEDINVEVTFMVDDEVYAVVNLQDGDTVEMPEDPKKEDCVFDGWYLDKDTWEKNFSGKIEDTSILQLVVYAKWSDTPCMHIWTPWVDGVAATCSSVGKKGRYCLRCGKGEAADIEKLAHTEEVIPAVEATCYSEGSTKGKKCSVCGEVLVAPQSIDKTEHNYGDWIIDEEANCTDVGSKHKVCQNEGCTDSVDEEIPISGKHIEEIIPAVEATCYKEGATEGKKCSVCGEVLVAPKSIAKTEHDYVNGICVNEGCDASIPNYVSEGLDFTLNDDGESYSLIGIGTCKDTKLVIPSTYDSKPVTSIGDLAFVGCDELTSVTIPDSVISIGDLLFGNCSGLESIIVSENNTKYHSKNNCLIETESKTLIAGCKNSIIPDDGSVTSIGDDAFFVCDGLTSITIPNSVTSIGSGAFENCSALTSITIPDSVTCIGGFSFAYCYGLTSIAIGSGVTDDLDDAFHSCSENLESITVAEDNIYYHSVNNCLIETASKTLILGCKNSIIPADGSVTSIGGAFEECSSLTSLTIPNSVTFIGVDAFRGCTGLTSITIPDSVTSIGNNAFDFCDNLQYNEYDNGLYLGNEDNAYYALIKAKDESITSCKINDKTKVIAGGAFDGCSGLTSVTIPDSVTSIGDWAFDDCSGLTSVTIPDSVTSIGDWAFDDCSGLTSITIGNGVTSIGDWAFRGCTGLTSVTIPNSVTSIGSYAFWNCSGLTSITIGNGVTSIGSYAFDGCENLTEIKFNGTKEQWNTIEKEYHWNYDAPATKVICTDGEVEL